MTFFRGKCSGRGSGKAGSDSILPISCILRLRHISIPGDIDIGTGDCNCICSADFQNVFHSIFPINCIAVINTTDINIATRNSNAISSRGSCSRRKCSKCSVLPLSCSYRRAATTNHIYIGTADRNPIGIRWESE